MHMYITSVYVAAILDYEAQAGDDMYYNIIGGSIKYCIYYTMWVCYTI